VLYGIQEFSAVFQFLWRVRLYPECWTALCFRNVNWQQPKIRGAIAQVFSTVASGQSQVSVSLSRIRTIKVTIIGSKQPGNYSISFGYGL
jgi:hypothetical protein